MKMTNEICLSMSKKKMQTVWVFKHKKTDLR